MSDADLVLVDGEIHTMDTDRPRARGLVFGGGRILAVGTNAQAERWAGRGTKTIDLARKVVVPGFIDAHAHLMESAARVSNLDLGGCTSLVAAVETLRQGAARAGTRWIIADGWDESRWPEGRYLTRDDIDQASETVPIAAVRVDRHMASVNSAGLRVLQVPPGTRGFEVTASGAPTGVLKEEALGRVWDAVWPSPERLATSFQTVAGRALSLGITTVHDVVGDAEIRAYQIARAAGELPLRAHLLARDTLLPHLVATGLMRGFGDEWIRLGGVKLFCDGSLGARTAALQEPYADHPGERGMLIHPPEELREIISRTGAAGLPAAAHAIGDRAIELVIDTIASTAPDREARHRIEHAELLHPEQITRMARIGIVASCQPNFVGNWSFPGGLYEKRLGPERNARNNPYREILRKGVALAFGSDGMPYSPLEGIHWAVNAPFPGQKLTVDEAVAAYTVGAAVAGSEEGSKGSLKPGKLGDAVVLDGNPWRDPKRIRTMGVSATIVNGRVASRMRAD